MGEMEPYANDAYIFLCASEFERFQYMMVLEGL